MGAYTYPSAGQPRPHAPLSVNGGAYSYDPNGNLISGGGRAPSWDANNLIDQIGSTTFSYDGLGERVKKTDGSTTSLYPFGDDYEVTNGVTTKYVSIEGLGVVAKKVTGGSSPGTYWIHADRLGSIDAVTTLDGSIAFQRIYRPYGETLSESGSHAESRGWIDQRNDSSTGLTYLHARYFDPRLGLFLSADLLDPAEPGVGTNRYSYALANPIRFADRTGFMVSCGSTAGGYVGEKPNNDPNVPHYKEEITVTATVPALSDCSYFDNGPLTPIQKFDLFGVVDPMRVPRTSEGDSDGGEAGGDGGGEGGDGGSTEASHPPYPFRDPCTTGFGGRFWDSFSYLNETAAAKVMHGLHAAEPAVIAGGAIATMAYLESARRLGTIPWLVGDSALLGEGGAVAVAGEAAAAAFLPLLGVEAELALIAAGDAALANQGCR